MDQLTSNRLVLTPSTHQPATLTFSYKRKDYLIEHVQRVTEYLMLNNPQYEISLKSLRRRIAREEGSLIDIAIKRLAPYKGKPQDWSLIDLTTNIIALFCRLSSDPQEAQAHCSQLAVRLFKEGYDTALVESFAMYSLVQQKETYTALLEIPFTTNRKIDLKKEMIPWALNTATLGPNYWAEAALWGKRFKNLEEAMLFYEALIKRAKTEQADKPQVYSIYAQASTDFNARLASFCGISPSEICGVLKELTRIIKRDYPEYMEHWASI